MASYIALIQLEELEVGSYKDIHAYYSKKNKDECYDHSILSSISSKNLLAGEMQKP